MNKKLFLLLFIILLNNIFSLTKEDIDNMINKKKQKEEESKFQPPNIAIFTFSKKVKDLQHFSRILQEFLSTIGISANIVNIKDNEVIATIPRGKTFEKKIVLDNFKDVIEKIDIADFTKNNNY